MIGSMTQPWTIRELLYRSLEMLDGRSGGELAQERSQGSWGSKKAHQQLISPRPAE